MSVSLSLYDKEHAAREKYIYFLCGVSSALFAYIGKDYIPREPWTRYDTLTISALICFSSSFLFGIGRILCYIHGLNKNREGVAAEEEIANLTDTVKVHLEQKQGTEVLSLNKKTGEPFTIEQIKARITVLNSTREKLNSEMTKWFNRSTALYVICHLFLIVGFIFMIWTKFAA